MATDEIAIFAITRNGVSLGRRLRQQLPGSHLYLMEKFAADSGSGEHPFRMSVKEMVGEFFDKYRYLVLIMAVGAAVRLLAPKLRDKHRDPGVVVMDEQGTFVVSLLSGHGGGANELATRIASLVGAQPVITTASDVAGTVAVDLLGREWGWEIEDDSNVTRVSAALVNGECIGVYQETGETEWWTGPLPDNISIFDSMESLVGSNCQAGLIITDRILGGEGQTLPCGTVVYRPKSLVIGIGCNRGTECSEIERAVTRVFQEHGLSLNSIRNIATIDLKRDEAGLLEFGGKYGLLVEYYDKGSLSKATFPSSSSAVVGKHTGTSAVCEPAAVLSSGGGSVIVPKVQYDRAITIAVARLSFDSHREQKRGKLFLVGIGPGAPGCMTFRARQAIDQSQVIIGYQTYVRQIEPFLSRKEVILSAMTQEVQRVNRAISLVGEGKTVAIVCGGDAGIYGMAGLVGEVLGGQPGNTIDVEVVPGVPALTAAAALLGAPLMNDFATISLSDYLVPWSDIRKRLEMAAQADFVIVLQNPKSKKRQRQLVEAREIILRYRHGNTPVGIASNAYRQNQEIVITDVEHMLEHEIGMGTTLIIGNSETFSLNGWMVTPRGYHKNTTSLAGSADRDSGTSVGEGS